MGLGVPVGEREREKGREREGGGKDFCFLFLVLFVLFVLFFLQLGKNSNHFHESTSRFWVVQFVNLHHESRQILLLPPSLLFSVSLSLFFFLKIPPFFFEFVEALRLKGESFHFFFLKTELGKEREGR